MQKLYILSLTPVEGVINPLVDVCSCDTRVQTNPGEQVASSYDYWTLAVGEASSTNFVNKSMLLLIAGSGINLELDNHNLTISATPPVESDPIFTASPAYNITNQNILDWSSAIVTLDNNILEFSNNSYHVYSQKKTVDPGYAYFYNDKNGDDLSPSWFNKLKLDGSFSALDITVFDSQDSNKFGGYYPGIVVLRTEGRTFDIHIGDVNNGKADYATISHSDVNRSYPIQIGDWIRFNDESIIIDAYTGIFTVNTTKTIFAKGTADKWLALNSNKELVYMDSPDTFWKRTGNLIETRQQYNKLKIESNAVSSTAILGVGTATYGSGIQGLSTSWYGVSGYQTGTPGSNSAGVFGSGFTGVRAYSNSLNGTGLETTLSTDDNGITGTPLRSYRLTLTGNAIQTMLEMKSIQSISTSAGMGMAIDFLMADNNYHDPILSSRFITKLTNTTYSGKSGNFEWWLNNSSSTPTLRMTLTGAGLLTVPSINLSSGTAFKYYGTDSNKNLVPMTDPDTFWTRSGDKILPRVSNDVLSITNTTNSAIIQLQFDSGTPWFLNNNTSLNTSNSSLILSKIISSGTPLTGYGTFLQFMLSNSTLVPYTAGKFECVWVTPTNLSEESKYRWYLVKNGVLASKMELSGDGLLTVPSINLSSGTPNKWLALDANKNIIYMDAPSGGSTVTPAALTKVDDTNITLTLGGSPSTALLQAVSITVGWTGTLADGRIASASAWNSKQAGNINLTSLSSLSYSSLSFVKMTSSGTFALDTNTYSLSSHNHTGIYEPIVTKASVTAGSSKISVSAGAAYSVFSAFSIDVNEANLNLNNISGTLSYVKGGTGLTALGSALQLIRVAASGTTLEYFTPSYLTSIPTITLSGDISGSGTTSISTTIGANKVTNAMLSQVVTNSIKGRISAGTGNIEDLTVTQVTSMLNIFTSTLKGLVPASGGSTSYFLRADGNWSTIPATTWSGVFGGTSSSSGTTLNISGDGSVQWLFTGGSAAVWTLPSIATYGNKAFFIKNEGTATLTIQRGGSDQLFTSIATSSITVDPSKSVLIMSDTSYWHVHFYPTLSLGELSVNAYRGDYGKIAYDHSQSAHQTIINGTGFVKASGTTLSYDNSTYLTGNQTITLSGEATGSGATSISVTLTNSSVIGKVLTGYTATNGTISSSDSILSAIQKLGYDKHVAVTIGTANGLSLSGQALSLTLASGSTTGALSSTNWTTFNNKQAALSGTGFVKISGTTISYDNSTYLTANQTITLSGDISGSGTTAITTTIGANKVTNAMLSTVATATFKGRVSASTGNVEDLTATQATSLLNTFTTSLKGLVPASGGGTVNFLRADGSWATPSTSDIRTNTETKAPGTHTISFSSTMGSLNYTLFVTIEQDGFQTYNGHIQPTSATGFDVTIPTGGNATITYTATKFN